VIDVDFPKGIHHIRIVVQMEDLFLCSADGELAPGLNVLSVSEVQGAKTGLGQICWEDISPFAKIGFPHLVAGLEVRRRDELVRFRVSHCDDVVVAHFRCDGDCQRN
jgi:hypothetical protein